MSAHCARLQRSTVTFAVLRLCLLVPALGHVTNALSNSFGKILTAGNASRRSSRFATSGRGPGGSADCGSCRRVAARFCEVRSAAPPAVRLRGAAKVLGFPPTMALTPGGVGGLARDT
jgi:hypothetical protein